ncbi:Protein CBG17043 [Caenorhabditis briggsae]|uniref:Protein CBG17043 n=1 Tax=Caenorhabditis briggsae TaxID=6238 RepID=A8XQB1_CAEBR|nr:Protein CBG17043 [Caenorhabditis briggsae]CAP34849.1 Protein CBG17043 [Caenorhabditis briggsae]
MPKDETEEEDLFRTMKVKKIEKKQKTPEPPAPPVKKQHVPFYKCSYCNYKTDDQKRLKRHTVGPEYFSLVVPGSLGPWVPGSLGPWVPGSLGPWVPGSLGPWVPGSLGPWVPGSLGPWVPGSLGPWVPGSLGPWVPGSLGPWVPVVMFFAQIAHQKPGQIMPECDVCHARFSHKFGLKRHQMSNCKFESFGCFSSSSEAPASPMEIPEISASPEPPMDFEIEAFEDSEKSENTDKCPEVEFKSFEISENLRMSNQEVWKF